MAMTHQRADTTLNASLNTSGSVYIWLHKGSPGADGTANLARRDGDTEDIVRKEIEFNNPSNHPTNDERRCLSSTSVTWTGAEIDAGEEITHFSIWSAETMGDVEYISTVETAKTTGSDGVTIDSGDVEVAIEVFVKP